MMSERTSARTLIRCKFRAMGLDTEDLTTIDLHASSANIAAYQPEADESEAKPYVVPLRQGLTDDFKPMTRQALLHSIPSPAGLIVVRLELVGYSLLGW